MYKKFEQVIFHSPSEMHSYYYSPRINALSAKLKTFLNEKESIDFFPDATLKSNNFPNGIAIYSPSNEATLIPTLLRDPGCGFLLFKIHHDSQLSEELIKKTLQEFGTSLESKKINFAHKYKSQSEQSFLDSILYHGLLNLNIDPLLLERFSYSSFHVEQPLIQIDHDDYLALYDELTNITNSIEIKKVIDLDNNKPANDIFKTGDIMGFLHTGTDIFPRILHRLFFKKIADHSYLNDLASVEDIRSGLYGISLSEELGYIYYQWIRTAMNYCLAKRWLIFQEFSSFIKDKLNLEVELINDRIHAGAYLSSVKDHTFIQSRGVQEYFYNPKNEYLNSYLLAGQRETISFLLTPHAQSEISHAIEHGTSCAIDANYNYRELIGNEKAKDYLNMCQAISANTTIDQESCLAYTFNILTQLQYHLDRKNCSSVHCLMPLANYQGKSLISRSLQAKELISAS